MIPRLFIGGPADGRRISLPEGESFCQIPVEPVPSVSVEFEQEVVVPKNYRREFIRGLDQHGNLVDHEVFVEQGVTPALMIGKLISKYPNPEHAALSIPLKMAETLTEIPAFGATEEQRKALRGLLELLRQYQEAWGI